MSVSCGSSDICILFGIPIEVRKSVRDYGVSFKGGKIDQSGIKSLREIMEQ